MTDLKLAAGAQTVPGRAHGCNVAGRARLINRRTGPHHAVDCVLLNMHVVLAGCDLRINSKGAYIIGLLRRLDAVHSVKQRKGAGARIPRFRAVRVNAGCVPKKMRWSAARVAKSLTAAGNYSPSLASG